MKKYIKFLLAAILFVSGTLVYAQISVDPQNDFYVYVQNWQSRGIIQKVPPLRPYPVKDIKEILSLVLENGNEKDKEIAGNYLNHIEEKNWYLNGKADLFYKNSSTDGNNLELVTDGKVIGDMSFSDNLISLGYDAGFNLRTVENLEEVYPLYSNYDVDSRFDPANLGPIKAHLDVNNNIALSKNGFILQAGINRIGYGDFINDGVALNDSSYHMPNFSVTYYNDKISYVQTMTALGATTNYKYKCSYDENGNLVESVPVYPSKFMAFHALEYKPTPKLSFSFYENVVFGKRFDFSYLIPTTYMVTQGISGFNDSIMMGIRASFNPVKCWVVATDLLVDDLSMNELAKFNLDSKNRIAWTSGVKYSGENFINNISLNYTMITPYTYAHWDVDDVYTNSMSTKTVNYQNYTNSGYTIGSQYPPDSDVIKLSAMFTPVSKMKLTFDLSFLRHANICESLTDEEAYSYLLSDEFVYSTDGSINTHQYGKNLKTDDTSTEETYYFDTAWNHLNFLTQQDKMYVTGAKVSCDYEVYSKNTFKVILNGFYGFEYIVNKGVDSQIYPGLGETAATENVSELVNYYKDLWRSGFHNEMNHYLTLGFTLKW